MGTVTSIGPTQHMQNFWIGCDPVSPGCDHCYMFMKQTRYGQDPTIVRRTGTDIWKQPQR